jgi:hypothetical protein
MSVIKNKFYEYGELKKLVNSLSIKSKDEYIKIYKNLISSDGKRAPLNPVTFYGKDIWINWSSFLDKPIFKKKLNNIYYTYEECKNVIKDKKIFSKSDFAKKIKQIINDDIKIPYNPYVTYKNEWEGWGEFLGTGRIQDNQKQYMSFEDARKWARSLNLKMYKEWRRLDLSKIPADIPKKPEKTYKNKGWVDYNDWLGIDKREKITYGEKKIYDYLKLNNIEFDYNKSILGCKNENNLRFDFYIPEKNICIEFDGIQHFKSIDFFGGDIEYEKTKMRDEIKNIFCKLEGIKLIRLPYFLTDDEIIEEIKRGIS